MVKKSYLPFVLPIGIFITAIFVGMVLLHETSSTGKLTWIDALFMSTSALCVTGLSVVDWYAGFTPAGHWVILCLMQLGGLGVMTYSTLAFYLWRKRVSLTDRLAVGQALLHDRSFHLGLFLKRMLGLVFIIEAIGAAALLLCSDGIFTGFSALFHAVSAFCNAGISLFPDNLMQFRANYGVNCVIMCLVVAGALGFAVLDEGYLWLRGFRRAYMKYSVRIVLETSAWLILGGAVALYIVESFEESGTSVMSALFHSVSARTAGFNTIALTDMSNLSLLILLFLMFIGGAPGSCAGGVKVTTIRTFFAFLIAQFRGHQQVVIDGRAIEQRTLNKVLMLISGATLLIFIGTVALTLTEGRNLTQFQVRGQMVEIFFEVMSAFTTVGISIGFTAKLTTVGKCILMVIMFVGRIGPIWLITTMHGIQSDLRYEVPETDLPVG